MSTSEQVTGGELIVRCLAAEGIRFVFGLPCPEIEPILAVLEKYRMRFVPVRHEAAAVHMAEGIYKTTGGVAAVIGNPGPGSANLLPGIVTARHEGVPVVAITAQHRLGIVYPSPPSTFQGQDQLDLFKPTVKWGGPLLAWERIPEVFRMAFREMWTGRPGPVHIEAPMPVIYATGDPAVAPVWRADQSRPAAPQPSQALIAAAADLLAHAQRPVVLSGSGVDRAEANASVLALVELLDCPVLTTMAGRGTIARDHPSFIYGFGGGGDLVRKEADVIVVVGSRIGNLELPYDKYWGPSANHRIIQIDIDARNIAVTRPVALAIVADARATVDAVVAELKARGVRRKDGGNLARYREADVEWWQTQFRETEAWEGPGIHPAHAARVVGDVFGRDPVYVTDGGMTSLWAAWYLPPSAPRSYHGIMELGMLGTGIPSAVGAKLSSPERDVVCVSGDGAAGFNFMEMQSAAREGLPLTVVVFAEGSWTMEEPSELATYGRTFGTEMGTVRWDKVAEGLGCHGEYVERLSDLEPALRRARSAKAPAVVCVRTDREANRAVPPEMFHRFFEVYQGPLG
jgi:acetolactate synthase-1/2/3 large subunit